MGETRERPILFSGEMVRAILDGRKTQTRRVVARSTGMITLEDVGVWPVRLGSDGENHMILCPYGNPGDRLWVRERIDLSEKRGEMLDTAVYAADGTVTPLDTWPWKRDFLPSIHCPRGLSRIDLEITDVRVERVQYISAEDAEAEGCVCDCDKKWMKPEDQDKPCPVSTSVFSTLWDSINAKRGYGWDVNPWVWVVKFKEAQ